MVDHNRTRVYIKMQCYTQRGPVYQARLESPDGPLLVNTSLEPLFAASRALIALGITGKIEMWDGERPYPRMSGDISKLAKLTVREDGATPPTLCRWRPFPAARGEQKVAKHGSGVLGYPQRRLAKKPHDRAAARGEP